MAEVKPVGFIHKKPAFLCQKCLRMFLPKIHESRLTCASCLAAESTSSHSAGEEQEPAVTNTSKPNTVTRESLSGNKVGTRWGTDPQPPLAPWNFESEVGIPQIHQTVIPTQVLKMLLDAVGGSLTLEMSELDGWDSYNEIRCEWIKYADPSRTVLSTQVVRVK